VVAEAILQSLGRFLIADGIYLAAAWRSWAGCALLLIFRGLYNSRTEGVLNVRSGNIIDISFCSGTEAWEVRFQVGTLPQFLPKKYVVGRQVNYCWFTLNIGAAPYKRLFPLNRLFSRDTPRCKSSRPRRDLGEVALACYDPRRFPSFVVEGPDLVSFPKFCPR
jgi:hypothetical protein